MPLVGSWQIKGISKKIILLKYEISNTLILKEKILNNMKQVFILIFITMSFLAKAQLSRDYDFTLQLNGGYYTNISDQGQTLGDTAGIDFFAEPTYSYGMAFNKFIGRNYQATLGLYRSNKKFTANYYCTTCDSLLVKTDEAYNLNYLNIPLNYHFILHEDVHSFYFYLGVSANILLNGDRKVYNMNNELVTADVPDIVKNIYMGLSLGLDYKVQISENVEILVGLEFKQAANSILKDFTFKNKEYGMHSGLVFAF